MTKSIITKFSEKCIAGINEQITMELHAFYAYQALYLHFGDQSIALPNASAMFNGMSKEELEHADLLMQYIQKRGGKVKLVTIEPTICGSISLIKGLEMALQLEKGVHAHLIKLRALAEDEQEFHFASFLEETFLSEQVSAEDELARLISMANRAGDGLGEYLFDQQLPAMRK